MSELKPIILLYGGSFDPIHYGHLHVAQRACEMFGDRLHEVWFAPCDVSQYNKKLTSSSHRWKMLKLALDEWGNRRFKRCDFDETGKTYEWVKPVIDTYPHYDFMLLVGSDSVPNLKSWYKWDDLRKTVDFLIVERPDYHITSKNWPFTDDDIVAIIEGGLVHSSTKIRAELKLTGTSNLIPTSVLEYIEEKGLYK